MGNAKITMDVGAKRISVSAATPGEAIVLFGRARGRARRRGFKITPRELPRIGPEADLDLPLDNPGGTVSANL